MCKKQTAVSHSSTESVIISLDTGLCKKQTSVSHCSTKAEIISVNASLRMDGIPALGLWDLVIEAFAFFFQPTKEIQKPAA